MPLIALALLLVGLAGRDQLAVGGDQFEAELTGQALLEHELRRHAPSPGWSLLNSRVSIACLSHRKHQALIPCMPIS
jgi:hypothetical protein